MPLSSSQKPTMAIFGRSAQTAKFMAEMLSDIFEDAVNIFIYTYEDNINTNIPIVMTTHKSHHEIAQKTFPNSTIISPKKVLTGYNLEKVMLLPPKTKVLVFTQPKEAILETINNFIEVGIKHLDFIPFDSNNPILPQGCDTAVSPGLMYLCPSEIKNKIDIGFRTIAADDFNTLLLALGLGAHYLDKFNNQYTLPLVQGSNKLANNIERIELLSKERDLIINKIVDGILTISDDKTIISLNNVMETIFGQPKSNLIGKFIKDIISKVSDTDDLIYDIDEYLNAKITINGTEFLYSCLVMTHGKQKSFIFTFKKASDVSMIEIKSQQEMIKRGYVAKYDFKDIWGTVPAILQMKEKARTFAKNNVTILISGESGTGKEILAQAIHNNSLRAKGPFLPVNFAALPESLLESELFGYEDGAFTGAKKGGKPGFFEMANSGTLFIDEIGDMPLSLQPRLLRILQERELIRIGGNKIIPIDVRVIAATNKDLKKEVANNRFRSDLYYRLNILSINTVPLNQFKENIELIIHTYLSTKYNFKIQRIENDAKAILLSYDWPGNVRELINVSDYIFYSSGGENVVTIKTIPSYIINESFNGKINLDFVPKFLSSSVLVQNKADNVEKHSSISDDFVLEILRILNSNRDKAIGRQFLMQELETIGKNISEHYLKLHLAYMRDKGFVQVGSTKQGTRISELGFNFLLEAEENN